MENEKIMDENILKAKREELKRKLKKEIDTQMQRAK